MTRKIVRIDPEKCDGCGLCASACAEKAIEIVGGKARLVKDDYCDGLGACIGECPRGAISIEERDAAPFNETEAKKHAGEEPKPQTPHVCPGLRALSLKKDGAPDDGTNSGGASELSQWPVQLRLVPVKAAFWEGADLLVAADCAAFANGSFHSDFLKGKKLVIACPKLDDTSGHVEKLASIIRENNIRSVEVVQMEVPCCAGLTRIAEAALEQSGKDAPLTKVVTSLKGKVVKKESTGKH